MGLLDRTPPEALTGSEPPSSVVPSSTIFQPSPTSARPKASSQIGSSHEKGTYSSAVSICRRGSVIPAAEYTSAAHWRAAAGRTGSRPGKLDGSERDEEARIHAGGRPSAAAALAPASSVITTAQAPSDDGHDSRNRVGSHIIGEALTFSMEMSSILRWA